MNEYTTILRKDGSIVVQDTEGKETVIDPENLEENLQQILDLNDIQIAAIKILADEHTAKLSSAFHGLLRKVVSQKNIVHGNISNVSSVKMGDEIHYHYHPEQQILPKELTAKMPIIQQNMIVGRDADLRDVHNRLFTDRQIVLVNGLGGIGKTTVAQAYLTTYWDEYHHLVWIDQSSEDLVGDFIAAKGLLNNLGLKSEGIKPQDLFDMLINELRKIQEKPNLLILDNANSSLSHWHGTLLHQPQWHILVTSRERIEGFDAKELGFLSEEDAVTLFRNYYTHGKLTDDEIKELVHVVDLHTLTVEILAKTAQRQRTGIEDLKNAIASDLKANVYVQHQGGTIERVTSYLCSIFQLTGLNDDELWMLTQFACLPAEFHSYETLEDLIDPTTAGKDDVFAETLEELVAKGWLLHNQETDGYKMHRIVVDVFKRLHPVTVEDVEPLINRVTTLLSIDQTKDNPIDSFRWVPFGQAILMALPERTDTVIADLQNVLALALKDLGNFDEAKRLLELALDSNEKNFGTDDPNTARSYSNLALVLQDLGEYQRARDLLELVRNSYEKNFGADHPNTAVSYSNLATVLKDLGEYQRAREFLELALESDVKNFGADHPNTARSYSNLALALKDLGNFDEAKRLLELALESDVKNFGPHHPNTAVRYSNLALVLQDLGNFDEAKRLLELALDSDVKNFGPHHPNTAVSYSNLATVLQDLGNFDEAKELFELALDSDVKNFGLHHPNTARSHSNLATVLQDLGNFDEAKRLLELALDSDVKNFGPHHPNTARRYSNLALVLKDLGNFDQAKRLLELALDSDVKNFGPHHPNTARRYSNLAIVLRDIGNFDEAKRLLELALDSDVENFGPHHPKTARRYSNLATVLRDIGNFDEAKRLLELALDSDVENFGPHHPNTAVSYSNLAMVLIDLGDYKKALEYSGKAAEVFQKVLPPNHPHLITVIDNYHYILDLLK